jgi:TolA-binding protein
MSELRKILGTSLFSLLLVIWGLFMVCSGRVPDVGTYDDFSNLEGQTDQQYQGDDQSDIMTQLANLDDKSTKLEDSQRREILEALGIDPNSGGGSQEEKFLTEELFLDLEVEIAELEKNSKNRTKILDSLKVELQEADMQLAALEKIVGPGEQFASSIKTAPTVISNGLTSEYGLAYQEALNEVYDHRYVEAITKFQNLLKQNDTDELADNCQYWIGESHYALGNFQLAIAEFEKVFAFEKNNKSDDAQFMIGMAYLKLGEQKLAQLELNNLLTFYQNSEYVVRAERQLIDLNI